eukprot:scaffold36014_cov84-Isochrysis_galbana.AAC.2
MGHTTGGGVSRALRVRRDKEQAGWGAGVVLNEFVRSDSPGETEAFNGADPTTKRAGGPSLPIRCRCHCTRLRPLA